MKRDWNPFIAMILFIVTYFLLTHVPELKVLAFITLAPMFYILLNYKPKKSFTYLIIGSLITYSISFEWLMRFNFTIFLVGAFSFIFPLILIFLANMLYDKYSKKNNFLFKIIFLSFSWIVISYLLDVIGGTLPLWMNFAIFTPLSTPLIWLIKSEGVTFLIILFNFLLVGLLQKSKKQKRIIYLLLITIGIVFIFCFYFSLYYEVQKDLGGIKVALVQANLPRSVEFRMNHSDKIFQYYKDITNGIENADIILWPEYAIFKNPSKDPIFVEELLALARKVNSTIIFGAPFSPEFDFSRESNLKLNRSFPYLLYNSAVKIDPDKEDFDITYAEEIIPTEKIALPYGNNSRIFEKDGLKLGTLLCWEEKKPQAIRKVLGENPDMMISLVNDPLLDYSAGAYLSSLFSRIYAAENKIYWVRVSNTGITQMINPSGIVIKSLPQGERNVLIHEFD